MEFVLEYKGYKAKVHCDEGEYFGSVSNIGDVVNFRAVDLIHIPKEFKISVDDYIAFCKEKGREPEAPTEGLDV